MIQSAQQVEREVNVHASAPRKRLIFCFDGTWNKLDAATPTNVVITAESVLPLASDGTAQAIFYDEGVGTGRFDRLRGGIFGIGVVEKLASAYRFLVFNYTPGDEILVFGFSRGAFTARSFVGMLRNCGVVSRSKAGRITDAVEIYRSRDPDLGPDTETTFRFRAEVAGSVVLSEKEDEWRVLNVPGHRRGLRPLLKVSYLGVWDTVGALGVPTRYRLLSFFNRKFQFHDTNLSSIVEAGRHAVAVDERRMDFIPTLWSNLTDLNRRAGKDPEDLFAPYQERWFPGVHCGVGGGGDFRGLSDQSLIWIWEGAQRAGLALDTAPGSRIDELAPDFHDRIAPFDLTRLGWIARAKERIVGLAWRSADRAGPSQWCEVSPSAHRRWQAAPGTLAGGTGPYRPAPLLRFSQQLDQPVSDFTLPARGSYRIVCVERGDTLGKIAARELGDRKRWREIYKINSDSLIDADHIFPGQPLRIPDAGAPPIHPAR
jgi:uncharacterized protein (DUF2235 family)